MLRIILASGFLLISIGAEAAQKKQCKTWINVSNQVPVLPVGSLIPPNAVKKARNAASFHARQSWIQWAGATHGQAYANPALANSFRITCQVNGSPAKSVLCEARGKPCRINNAPAPGRVLNRIPNPTRNRSY